MRMAKQLLAGVVMTLAVSFLLSGCGGGDGDGEVTPANRSPVADAGVNQTVDVDDTVTLDRSGSADPDGTIGNDATQESEPEPQIITGHKAVDWSENLYLVNFFTSQPVPGGEFWAVVSKEVMAGEMAIASLFWHDDDPAVEHFQDRPDRVLLQAQLVEWDDRYLIAPYRPHSASSDHWRKQDEFDLQRAFVRYMADIGVDQFNFYSHGGGGQIALILAGELPQLVQTIGLASPVELFPQADRYSPIERVDELPDVPILIVNDRLDEFVDIQDVFDYVHAAEDEGIVIRLVEVTTVDDPTHHYDTVAFLGEELHKEVSEDRSERIIDDGSINAEILAEVRDAMALSRAYAKERLGIDPPGTNVFIGTDPEWMTDRYLEAFKLDEGFRSGKMQSFSRCEPAGEGGLSAIFIPVCDNGWENSSVMRKRIYVHEWWHAAVQYYLLNAYCCTDSNRMQMVGPHWLMEGSAEVWVSLVLNDFASLDQEMAWRRGRVPRDVNLLDLNTWQGFREAPARSDIMMLATYLLMETAGLPSFLDFYRHLGEYFASEAGKIGLESTSQSPQMMEFRNKFFDYPERYQKMDEIFQSSFGRTMEEFAAEFREYLK